MQGFNVFVARLVAYLLTDFILRRGKIFPATGRRKRLVGGREPLFGPCNTALCALQEPGANPGNHYSALSMLVFFKFICYPVKGAYALLFHIDLLEKSYSIMKLPEAPLLSLS